MSDDPLLERVTASDRIYDGRILNVRLDTVEMADGRSARREIVEHAAVVAIVPVDSDRNVVLVRQYRLAAGEALLEIPAGGVDDGEDVEAAAQREMQEEIGHRAGALRRLAGFYVSPGYVTEFIHAFLATELIEEPAPGDEDEQIEIVHMPIPEALRLIERGEIKDAKSIIGLLLAAKGLLE